MILLKRIFISLIIIGFIISSLLFITLKKEKKIIYTVKDIKDVNGNYFPDIMELNNNDSNSFRLWYTSIAVSVINGDTELPENYADCAGLVRFIYKESLKKHDIFWRYSTGYNGINYENLKEYNYPDVPYFGTDIFKIKDGIYRDSFSIYASARVLVEKNMDFVSKNLINAKSGDILAYFHPEDPDFPYHLMIYLNMDGTDYVLYHTGPISETNNGEIRAVRMGDLFMSDPTWVPEEKNKYFMGIYKFKILK